jgi:hypothetical protein
MLALAMALFMPRVAGAATITFMQFTEVNFNAPVTFTNDGSGNTTIVATNVLVDVGLNESFCLNVGCDGFDDTQDVVFNLNAGSTGAATSVGGVVTQPYAGSFSFTQGGINLLTVTFSDELSGSEDGSNPGLNASDPPDTFSGTSDVLDPDLLLAPRGFAFSFSAFTSAGEGGLVIVNQSVASGTADVSGTLNASPLQVSEVPEPASLVLMGSGLAAIATRIRRRRKSL